MQEVHGGHAPSFLFFAKLAIQNLNIQPVVFWLFLAKMQSQQSMTFLSSVIL